MSVELINPDGIFEPDTYSQVAVGKRTKTIYLSGQVALDVQGNLVGKWDLASQSEQAYLNVATALQGVGASFQDIAKVNVYVVDWTPHKMEQVVSGAMRAAEKLGFDPRTAMTLIGVASLAVPDFLIDVEAVAIVD